MADDIETLTARAIVCANKTNAGRSVRSRCDVARLRHAWPAPQRRIVVTTKESSLLHDLITVKKVATEYGQTQKSRVILRHSNPRNEAEVPRAIQAE